MILRGHRDANRTDRKWIQPCLAETIPSPSHKVTAGFLPSTGIANWSIQWRLAKFEGCAIMGAPERCEVAARQPALLFAELREVLQIARRGFAPPQFLALAARRGGARQPCLRGALFAGAAPGLRCSRPCVPPP